MKAKHFLGGYIVKTCPWKNHEFRTDSPRKVYCSPQHQQQDKKDRKRQRQYREREIAETLAKPWGEWRLAHRELLEAPEKRTAATTPAPVVEHYIKVPVRVMSNFQSTLGANLPELDDGTCTHGYLYDCPRCWLGS